MTWRTAANGAPLDAGIPCGRHPTPAKSKSLRADLRLNETTHAPLDVSSDELEVLTELLESERAKLQIEIRHTDHRSYRAPLRERLAIVERLKERAKEG